MLLQIVALFMAVAISQAGEQNELGKETLDFAPVGAEWIYEFGGGLAPVTLDLCYHILKVQKEVELNGLKVREMEWTDVYTKAKSIDQPFETYKDTVKRSPLYVYSSGDSVYVSKDGGKKFLKILVFNLSEGDTVYLDEYDADREFMFVVESVTKDKNGLKRYEGSVGSGGRLSYMDRVGCLSHAIWPVFALPSSGAGGEVLRYSDGVFSYGKGMTGVWELQASPSLHLFPNPVVDEVNLQSDKEIKQVELRSANGTLLLKTQSTRIDLAGFASGAYFLKVKFADGTEAAEKLLKR